MLDWMSMRYDTCQSPYNSLQSRSRQWHEGPASSTIPTSHLPSGVYLLHISTPTSTQTTKLTIN
ncbi:MAG: T9SS type A sorting domain-containing protein [Muribaculaceae bacterium]|nr:T9SS type A sorting domain-containing protein [Muribaculaceae bacterium]